MTADAEPVTFLTPELALLPLAREVLDALLGGKSRWAIDRVLAAAEQGVSVEDLYLKVFQPCLYEVGRLWQLNRITVAHEHYASAAIQVAMARLQPYLFRGRSSHGQVVVAAGVVGGQHAMGLRMVADLFEMAGSDTIYLGPDVPVSQLVALVEERRADVVAISAGLPQHLDQVADLVAALKASPCRPLVLVGGWAFKRLPKAWLDVGADGHATDAREAVEVARRLLEERRGSGA